MELIIYNTAEYFHTIIKFFDDRITCINTGLYGVDDSSLHKEYNLYELNLKEIRKI
jgi:hypothetical protein